MNQRQIPPTATGIGSRFRSERLRLGFTEKALGDALGLARTTIAMIEFERSSLMCAALADSCAIGVDPLFVLTGKRMPERQTR